MSGCGCGAHAAEKVAEEQPRRCGCGGHGRAHGGCGCGGHGRHETAEGVTPEGREELGLAAKGKPGKAGGCACGRH